MPTGGLFAATMGWKLNGPPPARLFSDADGGVDRGCSGVEVRL